VTGTLEVRAEALLEILVVAVTVIALALIWGIVELRRKRQRIDVHLHADDEETEE